MIICFGEIQSPTDRKEICVVFPLFFQSCFFFERDGEKESVEKDQYDFFINNMTLLLII
jgi:hypothetical protein